MSASLTHVRLCVQQFEACFTFYKDIMGFAHQAGDGTPPYVELKVGDCILGLFVREYMAHTVGVSDLPAQVSAQDRVVLTFAVDDVDAYVADLKKKGVTMVNEPMDMPDWVLRVAHFRDPDGNLIEINQPLPD